MLAYRPDVKVEHVAEIGEGKRPVPAVVKEPRAGLQELASPGPGWRLHVVEDTLNGVFEDRHDEASFGRVGPVAIAKQCGSDVR